MKDYAEAERQLFVRRQQTKLADALNYLRERNIYVLDKGNEFEYRPVMGRPMEPINGRT